MLLGKETKQSGFINGVYLLLNNQLVCSPHALQNVTTTSQYNKHIFCNAS